MPGIPFAGLGETLDRRLSRRAALQRAGLAGAAVALSGGASPAVAQAPVATPGAVREISLLFVQSFESGTITPIAGRQGEYALTAQHGVGHTVYFSDRPERLAGAMPTSEFLELMAFSDPPNAALVVELRPGSGDVAVLELSAPDYDPEAHTLTYAVRLLPGSDEIALEQHPLTAETLPASFGAASLFIDTEAAADADGSLKAFNNTRVAQKFDFFQHIDG